MSGNAPATIWRDTNGLSEYTNVGSSYIVDTLINNLVDTVGNDITDTGVQATLIPDTIWEEDNSK